MADFGHICMVLALASALAGSMPLFRPTLIYKESWRGMVQAAGRTAFALIALAFSALMASFVQDDFSVRLVFENSHTLQPLLYKIAGVQKDTFSIEFPKQFPLKFPFFFVFNSLSVRFEGSPGITNVPRNFRKNTVFNGK